MTLRNRSNVDGQRHGSSGADSDRSTDTVTRGPMSCSPTSGQAQYAYARRHHPDRIDSEISPSTIVTRLTPSSARADIAPWEDSSPPSDLTRNDMSAGSIPSINHQPPWMPDGGPHLSSSSIFNDVYNGSNENLDQVSPGFPPVGGMTLGEMSEDRRPSIASSTTVSSTGSKSSLTGRKQKKLNSFFGEVIPDLKTINDGSSRHNSETGSMQGGTFAAFLSGARHRNNSVNDNAQRSSPPSPTSSRPRSPAPAPSSEVTPWVYQDAEHVPTTPDSFFPPEQSNGRTATGRSGHRLHLPGHRHNRSNEEKQSFSYGFPLRPTTSREQSFAVSRQDNISSAMSSALNLKSGRSSSPTPSAHSAHGPQNIQRSPVATGHKRSLFDRVTGRYKVDKAGPEQLQSQSVTSLPPTVTNTPSRSRAPSSSKTKTIKGKSEGISSNGQLSRKEHRMPFKPKRTFEQASDSKPLVKDPNAQGDEGDSALWHLDTDMRNMDGIVDRQRPPMTPPNGEIFAGWPPDQQPTTLDNENEESGTWDAPDSWAVNRVADENLRRLTELDTDGNIPTDDDPGPMYFMRIFRADSTFAVISASLNTTAAELISIMAKKTFLQDELGKYQIVIRKQNSSRQLSPSERPLVIQKRLLEMAGYEDSDHLADLGREDHGYLCRFTFLPSKMTGYSSSEQDLGFSKMQRFSHIDLSGRNLITIPITLHQKATEICTLNISRNLTLDIPKDFIQSCTQLREIKFCSNEAWRLPPSLSLASKLTTLDLSNNRLEQLDHAELYKLQNLNSLQLPNNKLGSIPSYFGQYRALRYLNISSNSLTEFPKAICDITTLTDLDISFNSISNLHDLGSLVSLEKIWATNNKLSGALSQSFAYLTNLREIDARFNTISNMDVASQLPRLESLLLGHNSISQFEGTFQMLKVLYLNHNPVTMFDLSTPVPTLTVLNLASAKLSRLPDALFSKMAGLTKLTLQKNHFNSLSPHLGTLTKLEYLSLARNELNRLPAEIGRLTELRYLDIRENNLSMLPPEVWFARRLETLNVSSNVLAEFPKPGNPLPPLPDSAATPSLSTPMHVGSPDFEDLGKLEDFQLRRPSQTSGVLSMSSSPGTNSRKGSIVSYNSSKQSLIPRTSTASSLGTITPGSRKDSTLSGRLAATFSTSLRHLFLADNRLEDDVFNELVLLPELRILNLSYNALYDVPPRTIRKWTQLTELYLSGNELTSIPSEDLEESSLLKVLHINNNKFQVLPAELGKVNRLAILDVGSNSLKYNVSNWPYDWNWNWNRQLRYLNLSGNKRLEIKPSPQALSGRDTRDLTDFSSLNNLRILGLMDVTLTIPSVPDQAPDRRVRLAGSTIGNSMPYGMADTLGRNEHLSTLDMVVPRFRGHQDEALIGLFDGQSISSGGSKVAKYLHEKFKHCFIDELDKIKSGETALDALRRTYLSLNKELAATATQAIDQRNHPSSNIVHRGSVSGPELGDDDLNSGSVATVMYMHGLELYVSNVGDAQALLIQSEGGHRMITKKHDPAEASERQRIREAGGYVSRYGKLNDQLDVSRAFGYVQLTPCIIAAPHVTKVEIKESDEMILLASRELWDYLTPDFAVDVARQERGDLMKAAQKLRDLAIAFGATGKIMVMMVGVSDLRKREKARFHRTQSMSMGPSGSPDDYFTTVRKAKRRQDAVGDSKLARLDQEVEAPTGDVTLVFTDIKNSTILWETYPVAMQSAIKMHNEVMRRHLRIIGGYEVKTEGDAFMVAFPTVTSALLWCFTIQSQLLEVQWPQEILSSVHGEEMQDADGNVIFRGLSVRMGIHWGRPVCEIDPVTKRMDYFGPMVNRAARIESVADGGQICVSQDFISEVQRMLETHQETDRTGSTGSEDTLNDDMLSANIRRELRSLTSYGFEVKDLGQRTLKGLENPEYIYLMYPHSLASRLIVQQQKAESQSRAATGLLNEVTKTSNSQLTIETQNVWDLWNVSLRLEMLCSTLEDTGVRSLKPPETALLEKIKHGGGEVSDRFLINFVEHQISRIETCVTTLVIRNMIRPFSNGMLSQACPMSEILNDLTAQLTELKTLKEQFDFDMAPA